MSRDPVVVHVGPYAEFLLREGPAGDPDKLQEALESGDLDHNLEYAEKVVVDGVEFARACYAPYFNGHSRPERKPPRQMQWSDDAGEGRVVDLTDVDVGEEVAWFERAYGDVLKLLAEGYGVPVRIRWGVVPSK
jgi:hypothetical protein